MAKSSTSFQPGKSGNPGGRPKVAVELRDRAQVDSPEAYDTIVTLMRGAAKEAVRLQAAVRVLQVAGVPLNGADISVTVQPGSNPYAERPTSELLSQAATSSTLPQ